jgi:hypothetical protein
LKIDNETAVATYNSIAKAFNDNGSLPESGLRILIDEAKRDNKITRDVTSNEVTDLSILLEAQRVTRDQGEIDYHEGPGAAAPQPKLGISRAKAQSMS